MATNPGAGTHPSSAATLPPPSVDLWQSWQPTATAPTLSLPHSPPPVCICGMEPGAGAYPPPPHFPHPVWICGMEPKRRRPPLVPLPHFPHPVWICGMEPGAGLPLVAATLPPPSVHLWHGTQAPAPTRRRGPTPRRRRTSAARRQATPEAGASTSSPADPRRPHLASGRTGALHRVGPVPSGLRAPPAPPTQSHARQPTPGPRTRRPPASPSTQQVGSGPRQSHRRRRSPRHRQVGGRLAPGTWLRRQAGSPNAACRRRPGTQNRGCRRRRRSPPGAFGQSDWSVEAAPAPADGHEGHTGEDQAGRQAQRCAGHWRRWWPTSGR